MVSHATCGVCHAPLPPDAQVCPHCGHPVEPGPDPAAPPAVFGPGGAGSAALDPPPWAPLPPLETPRGAGNGSGPVSEHALLSATAPGAPDAGPAEALPLPVRPAGALGTTKLDAEPALPPEFDPSPFAPPPAAGPPRPESVWLSGQTSAPPTPAPAPPPYVETRLSPVAPLAAPVAAPAPGAGPAAAAPPPTGALVLLRGEEVIMQLGALYLTNKRAILYAPTILRAAFLHDIDAIGTVTERSSGWMLLLGMLGLGLAAAAAYIGATQPGLEFQVGDVYHASPLLLAIPLALIGLLTLGSYFFWVKRSLFLSVGGRPLIVVSLAGWSGKKLTAVDSFVNAFSQAKERAQP